MRQHPSIPSPTAPPAPRSELHTGFEAGVPSGAGPAVRVVAGLRAEDVPKMEAKLYRALELAADDRLVVEHHIGVDAAELARVLFAEADVVVLDGHGTVSQHPPQMCGLDLELATLQRLSGRAGIYAPVLIAGACRAGGRKIAPALQRCLARPSTVLVASREGTAYKHTTDVFPPVLRVLAQLGPSPDPIAAYEMLRGLPVLAGDHPRGWGVRLLRREPSGATGDDDAGHCR